MADNKAVTPGVGATFATDEIGGVDYPRIKNTWGADGTATDVSAANPMPVVQTGTHNIGTVTTVTTVSAVTALTNALPAGTNAIGKLAANTGVDIGDVDILTIAGVAPAFNAGAAGATVLRTVSASDDPIVSAIAGTVVDGAADGGNSSKIAGVVHTALSGDTLEADGDRAHFPTGPDLVPYVRPHAPLDDIVSGNVSNTDGTSTQVIAAQAAGIKTYLTTIAITNMHASTVAFVEIKDGATTKLTLPAPPGGCVINLPVPIGGTAATAWNFDPSAAVTTLYCSMVGFKSKV